MTRKTAAALVSLTLASSAYFCTVVYLLSRSTFQLYGFPVLPDLQSAIELSLQICPMLAAFIFILTAKLRDNAIHRASASLQWSSTLVMLLVNLALALLTTSLTTAAIVSVCGLTQRAFSPLTLLWVAFEFTVDLTSVGIFTTFLHSIARRVWATLLLFLLYATVVVTFGAKWGITSFIGFGSTVPIRLTSYSIWPLYDTAGWLFRLYWIAVAALLVALLHRFSRPPQPLAVTLYRDWPRLTPRSKYSFAAGAALCIAIALCLFQVQQYALARYRGPSARRLESMLAAAPGSGRLRIVNYDLQLDYHPSQQFVRVTGTLHLDNQTSPMQSAYLELPAALTLEHIELQNAGSYRITTTGKYLRIDWPIPLAPNQHITLNYSGTIHPAGPFDLTLQAKLLNEAFFFTDADILLEPRQSSCILPNPTACNGENYTMSDLATGAIRVTAPQGFTAVSSGDRLPGPASALYYKVSTPTPTTFLVACARFRQTILPSTGALPAVSVFRAQLDGNAQAQVARSVLAYYQTSWPPYHLPELRIVETPTALGEATAFHGLLAISDRIVRSRDPLSTGASDLTQLVLAHEIAHQWWGYQVIPQRSPGRLFVLESFAQFAAYKYLQSRGVLTEDAAIQSEKNNYQLARAHTSQRELPLPLLDQNLALAYHKGPYVLLSLDKMIGGSLMDRLGQLLVSLNPQSTPSPQQIVQDLIEELPSPNQASARTLLYATTTQPQPKLETAQLAHQHHP